MMDQAFVRCRPRLLGVAYGILGDLGEAEDVVQDAWLRWQRLDRAAVKNPAAFLTTATTHLAINLIQSARHRHETPIDLPRVDQAWSDLEPAWHAERTLAAERMLGFLMTKLTASELAAYVLRKSFDYPYEDIATLLGTNSPNSRQLVRRAQTALTSGRVRRVDRRAHRRLVSAFTAATIGELTELERLLVAGVHHCSAPVSRQPVRAERAASGHGGEVTRRPPVLSSC